MHTLEQQTANTIMTNLIVGTAKGSKLSNSLRSMGTEMRPSQSLMGISCSERQHLSSWSHVSRLVVTCFWVDTEGTLKQVVDPFADVDIKPRVTVLQHDFFLKVLALFGSALLDKRNAPFIICVRVHIYPSAVQINKCQPYLSEFPVELHTCFLLAWSWIDFQRLSGFLSFWKSCCSSFLTCKHPVKVRIFSRRWQQGKNQLLFVQKTVCENIHHLERKASQQFSLL